MWSSWEDDVDDLRSWDELQLYLGDQCRQVRDCHAGVVVTTDVDELLVDEPVSGTARQRRALHRLGFRRASDGCWSWRPTAGDLPQPPTELPASVRPAWTRMSRARALDHARREMVVRVLREVYGCTPAQLVVTVMNDDGDDWEEDDDGDAFFALDCAGLEARLSSRVRDRPGR